jgi:hypothetical protein
VAVAGRESSDSTNSIQIGDAQLVDTQFGPWSGLRPLEQDKAGVARLPDRCGESGPQAAPLAKPAILAPHAGGKIGAEDILGLYQVALPYLDDLACLQWEAGQLKYEGFRIVQPAVGGARELWPGETSNSVRVIRSPLVMLDRGCYSARVLYRLGREAESPVTVTAKVLDASGCQVAPEQTLSLAPDSSGAFRCLDVSFAKPAQPVSVRLVLEIPAAADVGFRSMALRPDVASGVDSLARALDAVVYGDDPHAASSPANFDLLMTMGRKLAREGVAARSAEFFLAAAESCPARVAPAEALAGLVPALDPGSVSPAMAAIVSRYRDSSDQRRVQPADTMFSKGIRLDGFILPGPKVKAGESILLNLLWNVSKIDSEDGPLAIGIHFVDGQGCTVFQGDYGLAEALTVGSNPRTFGTDGFLRILVPSGVAPGEYRIRVGLWIPRLRQRLRVESSLLPFKKREVEIAAVTVE